MLVWMLLFPVVALAAGVPGLGEASSKTSGIAKLLFAMLLVLVVASWVAGRGRMG